MSWWMAAASVGSALLKNATQGEAYNEADVTQTRWSPFTGAGFAKERQQPNKTATLLQGALMGADYLMKNPATNGEGGSQKVDTPKASSAPADGGIALASSNPRDTGNQLSLFNDMAVAPEEVEPVSLLSTPKRKYIRSKGAASTMEYNPSTGEWYDPK